MLDPDIAVDTTWNVYNAGNVGRNKNPDDRFLACWNSQLSVEPRRRPVAGVQSLGFAAARAIGGKV